MMKGVSKLKSSDFSVSDLFNAAVKVNFISDESYRKEFRSLRAESSLIGYFLSSHPAQFYLTFQSSVQIVYLPHRSCPFVPTDFFCLKKPVNYILFNIVYQK